jgi:uncharacterized membrane protein YsdA (DUF1294 family)/cold shock CspA family protein
MERLGKVAEWNGERGFGFIDPRDEGQPRVFFHIRDYRQDGRRPEAGEWVKFTAQRQADGRWRATAVRRAAATRATAKPPRRTHAAKLPSWPGWLLLAAHVAGLAWALNGGRLPPLAAMLLLGLCCVAWIACVLDKHAATTGRRRIPESSLHLLELLGGWPGAFIAQRVTRHKTSKRAYRIAFWCMVVLNVGATWAWLLRQG